MHIQFVMLGPSQLLYTPMIMCQLMKPLRVNYLEIFQVGFFNLFLGHKHKTYQQHNPNITTSQPQHNHKTFILSFSTMLKRKSSSPFQRVLDTLRKHNTENASIAIQMNSHKKLCTNTGKSHSMDFASLLRCITKARYDP